MAGKHSTVPTKALSERGPNGEPSLDSIINTLERCAEGFYEQINKVSAVACGGEAWAGQIGPDGDEIDITSKFLFRVIPNNTGDASNYYQMIDEIAELRDRLSTLIR